MLQKITLIENASESDAQNRTCFTSVLSEKASTGFCELFRS